MQPCLVINIVSPNDLDKVVRAAARLCSSGPCICKQFRSSELWGGTSCLVLSLQLLLLLLHDLTMMCIYIRAADAC